MRHIHADLLIAWADGAQIQTRFPSDKLEVSWTDCRFNQPRWHELSQYRIKPKKYTVTWSGTQHDCGSPCTDGKDIDNLADLYNTLTSRYMLEREIETVQVRRNFK